MELPPDVRARFAEFGRKGGRERARRLEPDERARIARAAALTRWTRKRFGVPRFTELGLPGAELVDKGLGDVVAGDETIEALLIAMAEPRLRREGVPVPSFEMPDPERRCYRALEARHGDLAHARYNALRRQIVSFADACRIARKRVGDGEDV